MKMYFVKATYTDGIYKLSDFYVGSVYKQDVSKMQDINLEANDGATSTTVNTLLPDGSRVNDYSHVLVPDVNKIYEIDRCVYVNNQQTQIQLIEDSFIGNYQTVKSKKIRLERTNDIELFKGIHDVEDITIRPTIETLGTGSTYTGQWVLYFIDTESFALDKEGSSRFPVYYYDRDKSANRQGTAYSNYMNFNYFDNVEDTAELKAKYPEIATSDPLSVNYFNKNVKIDGYFTSTSIYHQNKIKWSTKTFEPEYYENTAPFKTRIPALYADKAYIPTVPLAGNLSTVVLAFPLEKNISVRNSVSNTETVIPWDPGVSEAFKKNEMVIRAVKIVHESQIFGQGTSVVTNHSWSETGYLNDLTPSKTIILEDKSNVGIVPVYVHAIVNERDVYDAGNPSDPANGKGTAKRLNCVYIKSFNPELVVNTPPLSPVNINNIFAYEPFKKYTVSVFGKEYAVSRKNLTGLKIRFGVSMNSIEYFGYINNDLSQKLFSDSYTTDISYSVDRLAEFNQQNPTYKDQFTANMWRKGLGGALNIATGAAGFKAASSAHLAAAEAKWKEGDPEPIPMSPGGAAVRGTSQAIGTAMNIGFDLHSEKLREKGLSLAPDQIYGDGSNISLAGQTKYGVFVNTYTSDFEDLMKTKYWLTGFPTTQITDINTLKANYSEVFDITKIIRGQLLETVRNKYTTNAINRKLQEGVILI